MVYDLAILGGGPAGAAASVYAARKRLRSVFITFDFGGQSSVSEDIQNWIGTVSIPGNVLAKNLKEHVEAVKSDILDVREGELVERLSQEENMIFKIKTTKGEYSAKAVLITTGSRRKKLEIPGAEQFENRGVTYCASCDGPLFDGMDVVVVGGGNAGFETAAQLLAYTKSVTLLHHRSEFKADKVTVDKVLAHPNMKAILNAEPVECKGEQVLEGLTYRDKISGAIKEIHAQGIFVEIGNVPNTAFVAGVVERTEYGAIIIDPWTQRTNVSGIWAAGDCTNVLYHQNNIAAGDGVKALEDIYLHLHAK